MSSLIALILLAHFHMLGPIIAIGLILLVGGAVLWLCMAVVLLPAAAIEMWWKRRHGGAPEQIAQREAEKEDARRRTEVLEQVRKGHSLYFLPDNQKVVDKLVAENRLEKLQHHVSGSTYFSYRIVD